MKACLLILLMLIASQSVFSAEDLNIIDFLDYRVLQAEALPDDLSEYNVIVIPTPHKIYGKDDIERLKNYVESGGGLMLLAEENNKDGSTLNLNQISREFSISFNIDRIYDDQNCVTHTYCISLTNFPSHPVFLGVTCIVYMSGCSIKETEGVLVRASENACAEKYDGLVTYEKGDLPPCMVFLEVEKGRIFACGDKDIFDSNLSREDNTLFALNVFDWLAGNSDRIEERLDFKDKYLELVDEVESLVQSAHQNGLRDVLPETVETAETLISEAKTLYDFYRYSDSYDKAVEARQSILDGEKEVQEMIDSKIRSVKDLRSRMEKDAQEYLPAQLEAVSYYLQEIEHEVTYSQKLEKAKKALDLCEEIQTGLRGAAAKEICMAEEKMEFYRGFYSGNEFNSAARIHLENAKESYEKGEFGEARRYARESQKYSDMASEGQKVDHLLVVCMLLVVISCVFIYIRHRFGYDSHKK